MTLSAILSMMGGIGLFLYGMKFMGQSLERSAGAKLEQTLTKLTSSVPKALALGTGVTAIIQSSAATIIMVVGFLNAGIMTLSHAVPVIMGANIGTTITAQILRLGDISAEGSWISLLKPASFAPIFVFVTAFIMLMAKRNRTKDRAGIIMGLGLLFLGMSMMEKSFAPLASSPEFGAALIKFENPLLGILVGIFITVLLQSSSASVGVLQAFTATGMVTYSIAIPYVIGANIGKCMAVMLGSIGTNKEAKRAVLVETIICVIGALIFVLAIYPYQAIKGFDFWSDLVNRGNVANFHTLFNIVNTVILLPFQGLLIKVSERLIREKEGSSKDEKLKLLDDIFLKNPSFALEQCKKVIISMGEAALENFDLATEVLKDYDTAKVDKMRENEHFLDKTETVLGDYLIKITAEHITGRENHMATEMMHTVGDFERIGDHCDNLVEVAEYNIEQGIKYSDMGAQELDVALGAVHDIIEMTTRAYRTEDESLCHKIWPLEDTIDELTDSLKEKHVERLKIGQCTTQSGISFVEMLTNMERISDHCNNISVHLHQRVTNGNMDKHHKEIFDRESASYCELLEGYERLYLSVVEDKK